MAGNGTTGFYLTPSCATVCNPDLSAGGRVWATVDDGTRMPVARCIESYSRAKPTAPSLPYVELPYASSHHL